MGPVEHVGTLQTYDIRMSKCIVWCDEWQWHACINDLTACNNIDVLQTFFKVYQQRLYIFEVYLSWVNCLRIHITVPLPTHSRIWCNVDRADKRMVHQRLWWWREGGVGLCHLLLGLHLDGGLGGVHSHHEPAGGENLLEQDPHWIPRRRWHCRLRRLTLQAQHGHNAQRHLR